MPYRRLPNTDNARHKALLKAYQKGKETPPFKLAFSQSTYQKVVSFLPNFEKKILQQKSALSRQIERSKDYHTLQKKARLYISHFIQVINMAIQRGEISSTILEYYKLNGYSKKLPPLNTEDEIIKWGEKIIDGETQRIRTGMSPVTNPTIAVVKVRYEKFQEAYRNQKNLQVSNNRALKELAELRPAADDIILQVWNEVEESFKDLPDDLRREKAMEYGLIYVYRKNELSDQNLFNSPQLGIS
ncbi:hypothetical protein ACFLR8_03985 [Bacteroidota bacterium]